MTLSRTLTTSSSPISCWQNIFYGQNKIRLMNNDKFCANAMVSLNEKHVLFTKINAKNKIHCNQ